MFTTSQERPLYVDSDSMTKFLYDKNPHWQKPNYQIHKITMHARIFLFDIFPNFQNKLL